MSKSFWARSGANGAKHGEDRIEGRVGKGNCSVRPPEGNGQSLGCGALPPPCEAGGGPVEANDSHPRRAAASAVFRNPWPR